MGLRSYISCDAHDSSRLRIRRSDGLSVVCALAGLRRAGTAGRSPYSRKAIERLRNRCARIRAFSGGAQIGSRSNASGIDRATGGGLILFGLSDRLWLSLVLMVFIGFAMIQSASVSNTLIQSLVAEDKRAPVMSYYTMAFFRLGSVWQPAGRNDGPSNRSASYRHHHRHFLHCLFSVVGDRATKAQDCYVADPSKEWAAARPCYRSDPRGARIHNVSRPDHQHHCRRLICE